MRVHSARSAQTLNNRLFIQCLCARYTQCIMCINYYYITTYETDRALNSITHTRTCWPTYDVRYVTLGPSGRFTANLPINSPETTVLCLTSARSGPALRRVACEHVQLDASSSTSDCKGTCKTALAPGVKPFGRKC